MQPMASYAELCLTTATAKGDELYDNIGKKDRAGENSRPPNGVVRAGDIYDASGRKREILRREREQNTITARESRRFYTVTTWEPRTVSAWSVTHGGERERSHPWGREGTRRSNERRNETQERDRCPNGTIGQ